MKTSIKARVVPLLAFVCFASFAGAQENMHLVSKAKVIFEMQQTPEFSVAGPRAKKVTPLEWLEIEVELDVKTRAKSGYIDQLDAEFFVGVRDANDSGKPVLLSGKFAFVEVRAAEEKAWLSAYVSPAALAKATGKNKPGKSDIVAVAVSVSGAGLVKPLAESFGVPLKREGPQWWEAASLRREEGLVLPKSKTPFSVLWTDRYPLNKDDQ